MRRLEAVAVAPDGSSLALQISSLSRRGDRRITRLWSLDPDGTHLRLLTPSGSANTGPVHAPDGRSIYFLGGPASGPRQVMRLSRGDRDTVPVTTSPVDVETFVLSRDGSRVAFSAAVFPGVGDTLASTADRLKAAARKSSSGQIHDRLFVRHWDEWKDGRRRHLFVQPTAGGTATDVMPEMDADAPSRPFGGSEQYTFTPDGSALVFTARHVGREEAWSTNLDLFTVPVDAKSPPRRLTENEATDTNPSFSPDGTLLAYLAMDRPGYESDKQTLVLRDWANGTSRQLTDAWDRSVDEFAWSNDGRSLYVVAQDAGQRSLFALDAATGSVTRLVDAGQVSHPRPAGGTVFFAWDSLQGPADLYALEDGRQRRLTNLNATTMRAVEIGEAEQFTFAGWNGETVHGYLVKPVGFDPTRRYPIAFIVHGGPQSTISNDWHYRWNPQVYAGAGYAVVMIDFHGSTGYGRAFTDSIRDDWGGKPLEDLQKGFAAALERYPFLDPARAAALGPSYGGYMINLMAGVCNEPWQCLVTHDGNIDERFAYFATEELWFPEWEHRGTPWDNRDGYTRDNPLNHVAKWRVPTLVIHGALDYRVSEVEGLAVFTALQRRGIPSRFLHFPDENHWVLKPQNSVLWHETVLEWLDRWTV
ncbi:MAG: prolyl oligopeptidase family serine peptidase [Chloroflexota bacterium]